MVGEVGTLRKAVGLPAGLEPSPTMVSESHREKPKGGRKSVCPQLDHL